MNAQNVEDALDTGEELKSQTPLPEPPQATPATTEATPARAALQSAVGNSRLAAAAATGNPPPALRAAHLLHAGHGNAGISRMLIQRKAEAGGPDGASDAAPLPDAATEPRAGDSPALTPTRPLIVEDDADVQAGQMKKSEFMSRLRVATCDTAAEALAGTQWSADSCPFIERAFTLYGTFDAARLERAIRKYAPEAGSATNAEAYIPHVTSRVRRALSTWVTTGQVTGVPEGVPLDAAGGLLGTIAGAVTGVASRVTGTAQGGGGGILLKAHGGGSGAAADPEVVQAQLGAGQSLDGGARQRMESAFGESFGEVRVHADAGAASLSEGMSARAFTVGPHIAFGKGEYQPGTPVGDALIAHELAHVVQQRGAGDGAAGPAQKGGGDYGALEADADRAAVGAVVSAWGGQGKGLARVSANAMPSLKSGLRLQRCDLPDRPTPQIVGGEEMEKMNFYFIGLDKGQVLTAGQTFTLRYHAPPTLPAGGYSGGSWYAQRPGESDFGRREGYGMTNTWTLDKAGEWYFIVKIPLGGNAYGFLTHYADVLQPDQVTKDKLNVVKPRRPVEFLAGLEVQNLQNMKWGLADQKFEPAHITLDGRNPALTHTAPNHPVNRYTVHAPPGVTPSRYQWAAVPEKITDANYYGHERRMVAGRDAYDLGTGTTARWTLAYKTGIIMIYCTMYDAQGEKVAEAKYRQVVLTDEEQKHVKAFQDYVKEAKEQLRAIRPDTAVHVPAVHHTKETGAINELSFFLGTPVSGSGLMLVDLTPGVKVREYPGSDFNAVIHDFNEDNSYPEGQVRLYVPADNSFGIPDHEFTFRTSGASFAQQLSSGWGWASLGLAALGVLAAVIPGAQGLAPVFFMASAGLGAASAGASLYQRSQEAHPSGTGIIIDIASLAGSLIGFAGAANILRHGPRVAAVTKTGRFVLYTGLASDVVGGVFILVEGAEEIAKILDGRGTAEEKASAVARVLAGLMLNGTLLAWGAKDLGAARKQVSSAIGDATAGKLTNAEVHALSVLEGPAMARLAGSSIEEVQAAAALVKENPGRAVSLIERYGEQFVVAARNRPESLEELAQALHAGTPELAGTRGRYGAATPGMKDPVYLEKPGKGQSSPQGLAKKLEDSLMKPTSKFAGHLMHGATLRVPAGAAAPGVPATRYELVIPKSGTRPEMVIPVRIESTSTRPVSVHGAETGPARMEVRTSVDKLGVTRYEASIEVHRDLASVDVPLAVGHELNELAQIATSGVRGADITAQKRAALMRPNEAAGAAAPAPTAHDIAAAREFEMTAGVNIDPHNYDLPDPLKARALAMGFGNPEFLDAKLKLLRDVGVKEEVLSRLRVMALRPKVKAALVAGSPFATDRVIYHLTAHDTGGLPDSPVSGAHLNSTAVDLQKQFVAKNDTLHLVRTADSPKNAGGVTYNAYEQWTWKGSGAPPAGSRPPGPGMTSPHGNWVRAPKPKTTFDDLTKFLQHAEATWLARPAGTLPAGNHFWSHALPGGGQSVGGYVDIDASGAITHQSVFPYRTGGLTSW